MFLLIFALVSGNESGYDNPLIVASVVGMLAPLGVFLTVELRQHRPMFALRLFRNQTFTVVPNERSGMASGSNTTISQVGFGVGVAGLGAILTQRIEIRIFDLTWGTPATVGES